MLQAPIDLSALGTFQPVQPEAFYR
jgi:hypothetical protein